MREVRVSLAISLDGFIAGTNGESNWIVMDPDTGSRELTGCLDTLPPGCKTHRIDRQGRR